MTATLSVPDAVMRSVRSAIATTFVSVGTIKKIVI